MKITEILSKITSRTAQIGVIGIGYVGLPLVNAFYRAGYSVTGFDVDPRKVEQLAQGVSYIKHISLPDYSSLSTASFHPTTDFSLLHNMDCILICVPSPLNTINTNRVPDMGIQ